MVLIFVMPSVLPCIQFSISITFASIPEALKSSVWEPTPGPVAAPAGDVLRRHESRRLALSPQQQATDPSSQTVAIAPLFTALFFHPLSI